MITSPPPSRTEAKAHAQQGETFRLMGNYAEAAKAFRTALSYDETYSWALAHLAATLRAQNEYSEALHLFDQLFERPGNERYAWAYAQRGETYRLLGTQRYTSDLPQAIHLFERSIQDHDRATQLHEGYAWAYAHRGATYRELGYYYEHTYANQQGDPIRATEYYEKAHVDFSRAIALNDSYAWAYAYRSVACRCLKRFDEAISDLQHALLLDPKIFFDPLYQQGMLLRLQGKTPEAVRHFRHALQQEPHNAQLLYGLAVSLQQNAREVESDESIESASAAMTHARAALTKIAILTQVQLAALDFLTGNPEKAETGLTALHLLSMELQTPLLGDVALSVLRGDPTCQAGDIEFGTLYRKNWADALPPQERIVSHE